MCGGCYPRFSDFFQEKIEPNVAKEREVSFDGKVPKLFSDMQDAHTSIKCRNRIGTMEGVGFIFIAHFPKSLELIRSGSMTQANERIKFRSYLGEVGICYE